jgi:hypothetical protein
LLLVEESERVRAIDLHNKMPTFAILQKTIESVLNDRIKGLVLLLLSLTTNYAIERVERCTHVPSWLRPALDIVLFRKPPNVAAKVTALRIEPTTSQAPQPAPPPSDELVVQPLKQLQGQQHPQEKPSQQQQQQQQLQPQQQQQQQRSQQAITSAYPPSTTEVVISTLRTQVQLLSCLFQLRYPSD